MTAQTSVSIFYADGGSKQNVSSELTVEQEIRRDEFLADIRRAWEAHADGFSYHMWADGRYYDSAVSRAAAFDQFRSMRLAGDRSDFLIGFGNSYRTTVSVSGRAVVVDLDDGEG